MEEPIEQEPYLPPEDVSQYIAEMKKQALQVLFPNPKEQPDRMSLITILRGRSPNMYIAYLAAVEWEAWLAIEQKRKIDWEKLDPVKFLLAHAPSIQGTGRKQAVEVARATPSEPRRGWFDALLGK